MRHLGPPRRDDPVLEWEGVDGTRLVTAPLTPLVFHPPSVTADIDWLWIDDGRAALARVGQRTTPLVLKWTEFGWETLSGNAINKFDPTLFRVLSDKFRVEYVTLEHYLDFHAGPGARATLPRLQLAMDDFEKLLPWGIGGDQLRRFGREVEAALLAAERFELVAHLLDPAVDHAAALHNGWRKLLAAQSHDVSLCEYSRHQGALPPPAPRIDTHGQTWGAIGYGLMDDALSLAQATLDASLAAIAAHIECPRPPGAPTIPLVVFNACGFARDALVSTGAVPTGSLNARALRLCDHEGRTIPAQVLTADAAADGRIECAELVFPAAALPSVGYATYYLTSAAPPDRDTGSVGLGVDQTALTLENAHVRVALDPVSGAIAQLVERRTGRVLLGGGRPFPTLTGRPNGAARPGHPAGRTPHDYNSAQTQATFTWLETGPLRARVRATHPNTHGVGFEITVTLDALSPDVDVRVRLFPELPPHAGKGTINGWQFPLEIAEGYWFEFAPAFPVERVLRDYPFGAEECRKPAIDALHWLDLLAADGSGLLVVHSGTQYFKRRADGIFANLAVREWESHYTGEFGWPRLCRYRYVLRPHDATLSPADRARAAAAFDSAPRCVVAPASAAGMQPPRQSFLSVEGDEAVLTALRRPARTAEDATGELRVVECGGNSASLRINTLLPVSGWQPTDAFGQPIDDRPALPLDRPVTLRPWEIKTLKLPTKIL